MDLIFEQYLLWLLYFHFEVIFPVLSFDSYFPIWKNYKWSPPIISACGEALSFSAFISLQSWTFYPEV